MSCCGGGNDGNCGPPARLGGCGRRFACCPGGPRRCGDRSLKGCGPRCPEECPRPEPRPYPVVQCCGTTGGMSVFLPGPSTCGPICEPPCPPPPPCLCMPPPSCPCPPAPCPPSCALPTNSPCYPKVRCSKTAPRNKCFPKYKCPEISWPDPPKIDMCCSTGCPKRTIDICYMKVCQCPARCCPKNKPCVPKTTMGQCCNRRTWP